MHQNLNGAKSKMKRPSNMSMPRFELSLPVRPRRHTVETKGLATPPVHTKGQDNNNTPSYV